MTKWPSQWKNLEPAQPTTDPRDGDNGLMVNQSCAYSSLRRFLPSSATSALTNTLQWWPSCDIGLPRKPASQFNINKHGGSPTTCLAGPSVLGSARNTETKNLLPWNFQCHVTTWNHWLPLCPAIFPNSFSQRRYPLIYYRCAWDKSLHQFDWISWIYW